MIPADYRLWFLAGLGGLVLVLLFMASTPRVDSQGNTSLVHWGWFLIVLGLFCSFPVLCVGVALLLIGLLSKQSKR